MYRIRTFVYLDRDIITEQVKTLECDYYLFTKLGAFLLCWTLLKEGKTFKIYYLDN